MKHLLTNYVFLILVLFCSALSKADQSKVPIRNIINNFNFEELKETNKSILKVVDMFKKYPDIGVIPKCGKSVCRNYLLGKT